MLMVQATVLVGFPRLHSFCYVCESCLQQLQPQCQKKISDVRYSCQWRESKDCCHCLGFFRCCFVRKTPFSPLK